jgi:hypothetical protein
MSASRRVLVERAHQSMESRRDENVNAWATALAQSVSRGDD